MLLALASRNQEAGGCNRDLPAGVSYSSFLFPPPGEINCNLARVLGTPFFTLFFSYYTDKSPGWLRFSKMSKVFRYLLLGGSAWNRKGLCFWKHRNIIEDQIRWRQLKLGHLKAESRENHRLFSKIRAKVILYLRQARSLSFRNPPSSQLLERKLTVSRGGHSLLDLSFLRQKNKRISTQIQWPSSGFSGKKKRKMEYVMEML